ncbi:MAG: lipoate--protein ligase family protein [Candidatus Omnitrophica bacterium]|nr:lipoate--protein ligase family protein [Candidatus Omnitrophota bacterium]
MKQFRLIRSGALGASENMALDEEIFKRYLKDGEGTLRLYRWRKPSFTYGFSQDPSEQLDLGACASQGVEIAKRITGGGILFHDDEITYSFACGKSDLGEAPGVLVEYRNICRFLIGFYRSLGLDASFALEAESFKKRSAPHELCSASHEKYDIVIGGRKIGGNAQKRGRQAVFQHGSIPCGINWSLMSGLLQSFPAHLPETVTCLAGELKELPVKEDLEDKLIDSFASSFGVKFTESRFC